MSTNISTLTHTTTTVTINEISKRPVLQIYSDLRETKRTVKNLQLMLELQDVIVQATKAEYFRVHEVALATQDQIAIDDSLILLDEWTETFAFFTELDKKLTEAKSLVATLQTELDVATCNGTRGLIYAS